jgi:hypothetical protein
VVANIVNHYLCMIGFLGGLAYDLSITRVINVSRGVDYVFGIDVQCIAQSAQGIDYGAELEKLRKKTEGANGIYLNRCFGDLVSAMKYADDTGFYCYRAIESLRHHAAATKHLTTQPKAQQWRAFREAAGCDEAEINTIRDAADGLRHGDPLAVAVLQRADLLVATWKIVHAYVDKI